MFDNLRSPGPRWSERLQLALGAACAVAFLGTLPMAVLELDQRADARTAALLAHDAHVAKQASTGPVAAAARAVESELIVRVVADGEPCPDEHRSQGVEPRVECLDHDVTPASP